MPLPLYVLRGMSFEWKWKNLGSKVKACAMDDFLSVIIRRIKDLT